MRFYAAREFAFCYKTAVAIKTRALAMRQHCATACATVGRARLEYTPKIFFTRPSGVSGAHMHREYVKRKCRKGPKVNALFVN